MTSPHQPTPDLDDEISLVDIIRFFAGNWRLIGLLTLIFTGLGTAFALSRPSTYERQLTFSIQPVTLPLSTGSTSEISIPELTAAQVGNIALEVLEDLPLDNATLQASEYDTTTEELSATLRSPNPSALEALSAEDLIDQMEAAFEEPLTDTFTQSFDSLQVTLDRHNAVLTQLDTQLAQTTDTDSPRRQALEMERAAVLVTLANLTFDQQYLQQAQADLDDASSQLVEIMPVRDEISTTGRSPLPIVVLSIIAGFMVAVLAALVRAQIPMIRAELAANRQPNSKP